MALQWKIIKPESEIDKLLYEFTTILRSGWIEIGDENTTMPICYKNIAEEIENFEVRDSDIFVMSYPKTGTTWSQEMSWMTYHFDFEKGKQDIDERFPFLELKGILDLGSEEYKQKFPHFVRITDNVNKTKNLKDYPRFIKCHLPWSLLPKDIREGHKHPKIIYVFRNPKDSCVSFYHHCRLLEGYNGNLNDFCKLYLAGKVHYGSYWKHILGFWAMKDQPNILVIRFEEMKKDLSSVVKKVATFLGKERSEEEVSKLVDHLSFESMKKNPSFNMEVEEKVVREIFKNGTEHEHFFRSGKVGSYKAEMSEDMIKQFDVQTTAYFQKTGIQFDY